MMRSNSWLELFVAPGSTFSCHVTSLERTVARQPGQRIETSFLDRSLPAVGDQCRPSSLQRVKMGLSRPMPFKWANSLTLIRRFVYGVVQGQFAGKGIELPGCWTSKGFSCPHFLGVLRHVQCLATITRCVGEFATRALLGHLSDPPERSVVAVRAASIRTHCRLPFDPPALSTPMQRIAH